MDEAGKFGLSFIVYCALESVSGLLDIEIPSRDTARSRLTGPEIGFADIFLKNKRSYTYSYCTYLFKEEGVVPKIRFLVRTVAPSPLVMAQNFSASISDINVSHYYRRLFKK
jgi:hypothetical protein